MIDCPVSQVRPIIRTAAHTPLLGWQPDVVKNTGGLPTCRTFKGIHQRDCMVSQPSLNVQAHALAHAVGAGGGHRGLCQHSEHHALDKQVSLEGFLLVA